MKRLLLTLIFSILVFGAITAQSSEQKMLVIEQGSFKPIQRDALTGVAIDQIQMDSSRRPCARIKMKIDRMTREEIDGLEIKPVTNNEVKKCKTSEYDNGLIIELTAKPDTRFYMQHDKFGTSNEVLVNLEPNKEYYVEAHLNTFYSITVQSNVVDADVYIDGTLMGRTSEQNGQIFCTIEEVQPGRHDIYCQFGDKRSAGQQINVHAKSIFFTENINIETEKFSVVFNIEPKEVTVVIDGMMEQSITDGVFRGRLPKAKHTYRISSPYCITEQNDFVVDGDIERKITLKPLYGNIQVSSNPSGAHVSIDGVRDGTTPYTKGDVKAGVHDIVITKAGYEDHRGTITINPTGISAYNATLVAKKQAKAPKPQRPPQQVDTSTRFESSVELGYSMHTSGGAVNHIGAAYIGGIRAGKTLFAGAGVGAEYNIHSIDNQSALNNGGVLAPGQISVPIFAHLRLYMGRNANHFVALSAGGKLFGKNEIIHKEKGYSYHTNGIFGDLGYGIKFGGLYIFAGASVQSLPAVDSYTDKQLDIKSKIGIGAKLSVGFTF